MGRRLFTLVSAVLLIVGTAGISAAQNRGTGGTTGGGTTAGGSTAGRTGGAGASSGTFGNRSLGGSFQSPNRSFGGSQAGQGRDTAAGMVTGGERFVRGNRQAGDFVGGDSGDSANPFSQSGGFSAQSAMSGLRAGQSGNGNRGNSQGNNNSQGMGGQYGNSRQQVQLRPTLTIEFDHRAPAPQKLATELMQRFNKPTARIQVATPLEVRMEGRTAVLRGAVATEHDRDLAERLALLEPGISSVRNELTVAPTAAQPSAGAGSDLPPPAQAP